MVTPTSSPESPDRHGVGLLKIASLLGIIDQALFWIGFLLFYLIFAALTGTTVSTTGAVTYPTWITVNIVYAAIGMLIGGAVIAIVAYLLYFMGFRKVKEAAPSFGAPTILVLIGLIGFLMIAGGFGLIIATIVSAISCASTAGCAATNVGIGTILTGIALIGLGALLGLIGVIGVVLGNWRAGKRYQESMISIGGILQIVPYVSIVGFILTFIGYMKADKKLAAGWSPEMTVTMTIPPGMGAPGGAYPAMAPAAYPPAQPAPTYAYAQAPAATAPAYTAHPAAAPVTASPACRTCGNPATFVPQYNRYYCYACRQYV